MERFLKQGTRGLMGSAVLALLNRTILNLFAQGLAKAKQGVYRLVTMWQTERFWVKQRTRAVRANFYAAEIVYASYCRQVQPTTRVE